MDNDHRRRVAALEQRLVDQIAALDRLALRHTPPAPLTIMHWAWRQLSFQERLEFLTEMLTPNERRALQFGYEEDEPHA